MTELIRHPEFGTIRTEIIGGEPWFCAKDVCIALGYVNHKDALKRHCRQEGGSETLPPKLKGVLKRSTPTVSGTQLSEKVGAKPKEETPICTSCADIVHE